MAAAVNYFEIGSPDPQAARSFYGSLFEWNFGEADQGYQMINTGQGGLWDTSSVGGPYGRSSTCRLTTYKRRSTMPRSSAPPWPSPSSTAAPCSSPT